jgi:cobalt-zinc-cadmium resistance protein CzcA
MLEKIPEIVLKNRLIIIGAIIILCVWGIWSVQKLPIDVYPDLNAPVVNVVTENQGMAPEEVETLITFPLETSFNSLPYVTKVRSSSNLGISIINIEFEYGTNIYFARQLVAEKLQHARSELPEGTEEPFMGPVSSMFADAVEFTITGSGDLYTDRDLAEWTVKPRLQTVPGVSNIINFGGLLKQYHVLIDQRKLINYNVTVKQVFEALSVNNRNSSGGFLVEKTEEKIIRGIGKIQTTDDIKHIVIAEKNGVPTYIEQVAEVEIGPFVRRGSASENGSELVAITVQNQYNANVMNTINGVMGELNRLKQTLGQDISLNVFYTQLDMIRRAAANVWNSIYLSAALVILVLVLFMGNVRITIITTLSIPLSIIIAFIFLRLFHLTLNIMTMGGLVIGIGMIVDASIIMSENIYRYIQLKTIPVSEAVITGAREVVRPIFFATIVLIASFAPVFALQGLEGKMFVPLSIAVSTAMFGSLIVSFTFAIISCSLVVKPKKKVEKDTLPLRLFRAVYNRLLHFSFNHRALMITICTVLLFCAFFAFQKIGTEFMPEMDESSLMMDILLPPGTSLDETTRMSNNVAKEVSAIPGVLRVVNRTGRAEGAEHAEPVNLTETNIVLVPKEQRSRSIQEIKDAIRARVGNIPGVAISLNSPLQHRINHTITGTKAAIAVKLFGDDLEILRQYALRIEEAVIETPGTADVMTEQTTDIPQMQILLNREKIARYGINVDDISSVIEIALNGKVATELYETRKRYDIFVRFKEEYRNNAEEIKNILIDTPSRVRVPLAELASFVVEQGPSIIRKEGAMRRIMVQSNVAGRDMGSVVEELKKKISALDLPKGYFVVFGGTYENQIRAMRQLVGIIIMTIIVVFILLYIMFGSLRQAFLVVFNVPIAMAGGMIALFISGMNLSVPSIVGFIALTGISVQDGIVLLNEIRLQRERGVPLQEALIQAGNVKLRPVLLTTLAAILGLLPLVIMTGTGAEIQRPLGLVLMVGLIFSWNLTLVVLPTLYSLVEEEK